MIKPPFNYLTQTRMRVYPEYVGGRDDFDQRARVFDALSDLTRLQMIDLLARNGCMSGSEIAERLGISLALHCHHTKRLCESGVIAKRKGQTTWCTLNE